MYCFDWLWFHASSSVSPLVCELAYLIHHKFEGRLFESFPSCHYWCGSRSCMSSSIGIASVLTGEDLFSSIGPAEDKDRSGHQNAILRMFYSSPEGVKE